MQTLQVTARPRPQRERAETGQNASQFLIVLENAAQSTNDPGTLINMNLRMSSQEYGRTYGPCRPGLSIPNLASYCTRSFMLLTLYSVLRTIPLSQEAAAEIHGATRWSGQATPRHPCSIAIQRPSTNRRFVGGDHPTVSAPGRARCLRSDPIDSCTA